MNSAISTLLAEALSGATRSKSTGDMTKLADAVIQLAKAVELIAHAKAVPAAVPTAAVPAAAVPTAAVPAAAEPIAVLAAQAAAVVAAKAVPAAKAKPDNVDQKHGDAGATQAATLAGAESRAAPGIASAAAAAVAVDDTPRAGPSEPTAVSFAAAGPGSAADKPAGVPDAAAAASGAVASGGSASGSASGVVAGTAVRPSQARDPVAQEIELYALIDAEIGDRMMSMRRGLASKIKAVRASQVL